MAKIISVAEALPPNEVKQEKVAEFTKHLFADSFKDIDRLLKVFQNGQVEKRHFAKELSWYKEDHSFAEKNSEFVQMAVELGVEAVRRCLASPDFLNEEVGCEEIDAIFFITTTGLATPSIEARIMNCLPFTDDVKRIPIWGLGCTGGASGLSRAFEYCRAFPEAKVLVLSVELCSLTFQRDDRSKSNLIGTSLFADGAACVLLAGNEAGMDDRIRLSSVPEIERTKSILMKNSLDVMGWDVKENGLYVIFSKDIPAIVEKWLKLNVASFLDGHGLSMKEIKHFIAHPGGKKVLDAYVSSLCLDPEMVDVSLSVLRNFGNMSSATILFVLKRFLPLGKRGDLGLCTALGPGFSSEFLLLRWT